MRLKRNQEKYSGFASDIFWVQKNYSKVDTLITSNFSEHEHESIWSYAYENPSVIRSIIADRQKTDFEKWQPFFGKLLTEEGLTIIITGDRGRGKDALLHWVDEVLHLSKIISSGEFAPIEAYLRFLKSQNLVSKKYNYAKLTIDLAKWIARSNFHVFENIVWLGPPVEHFPDYFQFYGDMTVCPTDALINIDEGATMFSSYKTNTKKSFEALMQQITARHSNQTVMIVTQSSAILNINFFRMYDMALCKYMSSDHIKLARKDDPLSKINFMQMPGDKPETLISIGDYYTSLATNPLCTYWNNKTSKVMTKITSDEEAWKIVKYMLEHAYSPNEIAYQLASRSYRIDPEEIKKSDIFEEVKQKLLSGV